MKRFDLAKIVRDHLEFGLYFDAKIQEDYIIARKDKEYKVVPFFVTDTITIDELHGLGKVVLAIVSPDSTIVYYKAIPDPVLDFTHPEF